MSFGLATLTFVHVLISLVAIGAGFVEVYGLLTHKRFDHWTTTFLATTIATSATGFLFPVDRLLPSHVFGILSLIILGVAVVARHQYHLAGGWNTAYIVSAVMAFYLNFFVLIVQSFLKVPALKALAPSQTELPFAAAQLAALILFVGFGVVAVVRSRPVLVTATRP